VALFSLAALQDSLDNKKAIYEVISILFLNAMAHFQTLLEYLLGIFINSFSPKLSQSLQELTKDSCH